MREKDADMRRTDQRSNHEMVCRALPPCLVLTCLDALVFVYQAASKDTACFEVLVFA